MIEIEKHIIDIVVRPKSMRTYIIHVLFSKQKLHVQKECTTRQQVHVQATRQAVSPRRGTVCVAVLGSVRQPARKPHS